VQVIVDFDQQLAARLLQLTTVMNVFDRLFETNSDEQTDDNRGDVDEETFPGVNRFVRSVHIEHGR
jgi:hypothetical protein